MLLALIFVALALATLAIIALPLLRPAPAVADRQQFDRAVYRDQLRELERDLTRGVLSMAEAASARLEVQRRLLAADHRDTGGTLHGGRSPVVAAAIAAFVLIGAGAMYLKFGSPSLPDMPFASRSDNTAVVQAGSNHVDMKDAAAKLRAKLTADPNNGEGWALYARTESILGNYAAAKDAYNRAIALGQTGAEVLASYGEMLVLGEQGIVPPAAKDVFNRTLAADPKNDVARYYLALAAAQAGDVKQAIADWSSLAADLPDDSPMRPELERRVADAAQSGGIPAPPLPKGKAAQSVQDAAMQEVAKMPEAQRNEMVRGMVTQLAAKLQQAPNDLDGWLQLGRSYTVLGERDNAVEAFEKAAALRPADVSIRLQELEAMLAGLKPNDPLPAGLMGLLKQVQLAAPDQPEVLWYLGVVAARESRSSEARGYWTRLLKQLPADGEDAKMVKAALEQVK
jgi:cytochrome c-type biogenesis protein CcmH